MSLRNPSIEADLDRHLAEVWERWFEWDTRNNGMRERERWGLYFMGSIVALAAVLLLAACPASAQGWRLPAEQANMLAGTWLGHIAEDQSDGWADQCGDGLIVGRLVADGGGVAGTFALSYDRDHSCDSSSTARVSGAPGGLSITVGSVLPTCTARLTSIVMTSVAGVVEWLEGRYTSVGCVDEFGGFFRVRRLSSEPFISRIKS